MLTKYALIKALRVTLSKPARKFSIVGLSKESGLAASAAKYCLEYMLEMEIVSLEVVGKTHQYQANLENPLTRQWKILFSLEDLNKSKIVKSILKASKSVLSIVLYGSTASGRDDENSDIDLLVIADVKQEGKDRIAALATGTRREPNISIYTPEEWRNKARKDNVFYQKVLLNSVELYGEKPVVL
ncbi:nucleotidyltransferase domain-containing protein [Candidatus Micrarchaeota archaeon]|nr:nucleotidyltransferase domain-containing protein [Candidatus Micrarchaeota archaeon]